MGKDIVFGTKKGTTDARSMRPARLKVMAAFAAAVVLMGLGATTTAAYATGGHHGGGEKPPKQQVNCETITADYNRPLTNGDHINVTVDPPGGQVNMYVDQNVAGGASYNGQNGLGLRWKILGNEQTPIPLTVDQVKAGVITFNYGAALNKQGVYSWTVKFVQTNSTDTWPNKECSSTPPATKDASASAEVETAASCNANSAVKFNISNATWDNEAQIEPGTYTRTATANKGHLFEDGESTKTVEYTIDPVLPSQSLDPKGECYVPPTELESNAQYDYVLSCGKVVATFTNPVELVDGQTAKDAVFTITDIVGVEQTITVPANETRVITVEFIEDSGSQVVKLGEKGGVQQSVSVPTDCLPPAVTEFTPIGVSFTDSCGISDDGYAVPGTLTEATSSTDDQGNVVRVELYTVPEGTYTAYDVTYQGERSVAVLFVPSSEDVVVSPPMQNDSYTLFDGAALWEYTYTNEECAVTPPTTPEEPEKPTEPTTPVTPDKPVTPEKPVVSKTSTVKATGLANTGTDPMPGAMIAGSLLLLGLSLVAARKVRARASAQD